MGLSDRKKKILSCVVESYIADGEAVGSKTLQAALDFAFKAIDVAATKNIIHANNASNKKAKLAKKVFAASKGAVAPIVEEVAPVVEEVKEEVAEVAEAPVKKPRARKTTAKKEADAE